MSTKFEQLLDLLVNEEMDKANELFHEIVVEKSREIYENLIADEAKEQDEDEQQDEAKAHDEDEQQDEAMDREEDDQQDESAELESSYVMDGEDDEDEYSTMPVQDKGDDSLDDIEADSMDGEDPMDHIKDAIAELQAAFAELEAEKGMGSDDSMDMDMDMGGDDEKKADEMMGVPAMEGRRMTREYRETVGNDWEKNSQKSQGQYAGANTGDKMSAPVEGKSPISSGSGKPTSGANAKNIAAKSDTHNEDGTKPHGKVGGLVSSGGEFVGKSTHNVNNVKSGVKTLSKVAKPADAEGHAVGAGTGDNNVKGATNTTSPLKHIK